MAIRKLFLKWYAFVQYVRGEMGDLLESKALSGPDDRRALRGNLGALRLRVEDLLRGGTQQPVSSCEA